MALFTIVYASLATHHLSDRELINLLKQSRAYNESNSITGILLYRDDCFIQVLEGEESIIELLFQRISLDNRHRDVLVVFKKIIEKRRFPRWAMGFESPDFSTIRQIPGFSEYIQLGQVKNQDSFLSEFSDEIEKLLYPFIKNR